MTKCWFGALCTIRGRIIIFSEYKWIFADGSKCFLIFISARSKWNDDDWIVIFIELSNPYLLEWCDVLVWMSTDTLLVCVCANAIDRHFASVTWGKNFCQMIKCWDWESAFEPLYRHILPKIHDIQVYMNLVGCARVNNFESMFKSHLICATHYHTSINLLMPQNVCSALCTVSCLMRARYSLLAMVCQVKCRNIFRSYT